MKGFLFYLIAFVSINAGIIVENENSDSDLALLYLEEEKSKKELTETKKNLEKAKTASYKIFRLKQKLERKNDRIKKDKSALLKEISETEAENKILIESIERYEGKINELLKK